MTAGSSEPLAGGVLPSALDPAPAALVIAEARRWVGTPYLHQASTRGAGCDCLGLARGIWRALHGAEAGPIPAYTPFWGETGRREVLLEALRARMIGIPPDLAAPGALLVFRMAPGRLAKHCGILIEGGRMIHAMQGAGVIETGCDRSWRRRTVAAFLFPRGGR